MAHGPDQYARNLPPLPWTLDAERDGYVRIHDSEGKVVGALWGDPIRVHACQWLLRVLLTTMNPDLRDRLKKGAEHRDGC